jgi:hypothetical protein
MKTGSWLEVIKLAAHLEDCHLNAKGARQLEPGATPQELDFTGSVSAESAIQRSNATRK